MSTTVLLPLAAALWLLIRSELGPFLLHRPLATGGLLGALAGVTPAGLLLGALCEWIWIDRIPAGGYRVPAVDVGVAAGVLALALAPWPHGDPDLGVALLLVCLYTAAFVPLDGGLRRLWNIAGDNAVAALERGSTAELRLLLPLALAIRVLALYGGLALAPRIAGWLSALAPATQLSGWIWIPPAVATLYAAPALAERRILRYLAAFVIGVLCT